MNIILKRPVWITSNLTESFWISNLDRSFQSKEGIPGDIHQYWEALCYSNFDLLQKIPKLQGPITNPLNQFVHVLIL